LFDKGDWQEAKDLGKLGYDEIKDDIQDFLEAKNLTWEDFKESFKNRNHREEVSLWGKSEADEWKEAAHEGYDDLREDFKEILESRNITWDSIREMIKQRANESLNATEELSLFDSTDAEEWKDAASDRFDELKGDFKDILEQRNLTWDDVKEYIRNRRDNQNENDTTEEDNLDSDEL
jgi:hypothetical protein